MLLVSANAAPAAGMVGPWAAAAFAFTAPPGRPAVPSAGIGYVGLAEMAYQRGQLDEALRHVTEGIA